MVLQPRYLLFINSFSWQIFLFPSFSFPFSVFGRTTFLSLRNNDYTITAMGDCREKNFREIQKLLDGCIAYEYDKIIRALTLKREYFTKEQVKEYLRQEIFCVTDSLVVMQQKYRVLRNVRMDMYIPDFLWESAFFEDLNPNERKKYINFPCSSFDMDKYLFEPTYYDEQLPYFSIIIDFVVSTKYLNYLQENEKAFYPVETTEEFIIQPKEGVQTEEKPKKILGKSNPFQSKLKSAELKLLAECLNESRMFTTLSALKYSQTSSTVNWMEY